MKTFRLYVKRVSTVYLDVNIEAKDEAEALRLAEENAENEEYTDQFHDEEMAGNYDDSFSAQFYYKTNKVLKREKIPLKDLNELCKTVCLVKLKGLPPHCVGSCEKPLKS